VPFYFKVDHPGLLSQSTRKETLTQFDVVSVETAMLSAYVTEPVDFLKMDIEGSEAQVMKDRSEKDKLPLVREMVLEYHHHLTPEEDKLGIFLSSLKRANLATNLELRCYPLPKRRVSGFPALRISPGRPLMIRVSRVLC